MSPREAWRRACWAVISLGLGCAAPNKPTGDVDPADPTPDEESGFPDDIPADPASLATLPEAPDLDPAEGRVEVHLRAHTATWRVPQPDGEPLVVEGYAYSGSSPGPTIRARVGDTVVVELQNDLSVPTTIHWHACTWASRISAANRATLTGTWAQVTNRVGGPCRRCGVCEQLD